MQYRALLPAAIKPGEKLPVVYLLHGAGGDFRDWSDDSSVARFAEHGLILVMPQGDSSYYTNAANRSGDRYEDYLVTDLIHDVEAHFPAASGRDHRAIIGVSMGGYGAIKLALTHPHLYVFAGGLSAALDVPSRPFSIKRISQWRNHREIFGPWGGETQLKNDPYVLAQSADPAKTPYIFLACGEQEALLPADRKFAALLATKGFQYEFHTARGDHTWTQWETWLDACFQSLLKLVEHAERAGPAAALP
jgi:S-formylglutathione hydrolase FrmB